MYKSKVIFKILINKTYYSSINLVPATYGEEKNLGLNGRYDLASSPVYTIQLQLVQELNY